MKIEWIFGLGVLAIGGWCFLAGPCKDKLSELTNGTNTTRTIITRPQYTSLDREKTEVKSVICQPGYASVNGKCQKISSKGGGTAFYVRSGYRY